MEYRLYTELESFQDKFLKISNLNTGEYHLYIIKAEIEAL